MYRGFLYFAANEAGVPEREDSAVSVSEQDRAGPVVRGAVQSVLTVPGHDLVCTHQSHATPGAVSHQNVSTAGPRLTGSLLIEFG